jgi:hypothetical protein
MTSGQQSSLRRWRITLFAVFPQFVASDMSNGLPQKLEFGSRIGQSATHIGGIAVRLSASPDQHPELAGVSMREAARLEFEVDATDPSDAIALATGTIDLVIDDLSFQLQEPLQTFSMYVLDITAPLSVGEDREFMQFTSYDQYKLSRSVPMGDTHPVLVPALRDTYSQLPSRSQDALDWYIKSMHTPWDADRYIFLWVCVEILMKDSGPKIEEPTRLRCQHEIPSCPQCGKATLQVRQAASAYAYFESFGLDSTMAKDLWDMRQLVHGAKSFTKAKLDRLGELSQVLRSVAAAALRTAMGIPANEPPFVGYGVVAIGAAMGIGGTRALEVADLR